MGERNPNCPIKVQIYAPKNHPYEDKRILKPKTGIRYTDTLTSSRSMQVIWIQNPQSLLTSLNSTKPLPKKESLNNKTKRKNLSTNQSQSETSIARRFRSTTGRDPEECFPDPGIQPSHRTRISRTIWEEMMGRRVCDVIACALPDRSGFRTWGSSHCHLVPC